MKKYMKYFIVSIFAFVFLIGSVNAITIKETIIKGDTYDTIEDGSIIIGVTKFNSDVVITGARATKAGSNDAIVYMMLNSSLDGYSAPLIYIYAGGSWFALDENNQASVVEDASLIDKLSNNDIYFVNNEEKKIDVDVSAFNVNVELIPEGITYKDKKVYVPATMPSFEIQTEEGKVIEYIKNDKNEFVIDNSKCFSVSNGIITDYNNTCLCDVEVPSKIDGINITGIAQGAFQNKGITTVIIPGSIMTIEANAFADNNLTSVIIKDKYDESDFTTLADTAFGSFTDVKYQNDLTDLLDQFEDHLVLNVREGVIDITATIDGGAGVILGDSISSLPYFAEYLEFKRLGLTKVDGYVNNKYHIDFFYEYDYETYEPKTDKFKLTIGFLDSEKQKYNSVEKYVSYELNEVETENDYYKNIEEEYENYFEEVKTKIVNKDYSEKLVGYDKIYELVDKYGYSAYLNDAELGVGEGIIFADEYLIGVELIYEDVLYGLYYEMPYYNSIEYKIELETIPETDDEIYEAMVLNFEQNSKIANYKVTAKDFWTNSANGSKRYSINIVDESTDNMFTLETNIQAEKGSIIEQSRNEYGGQTYVTYSYIPTKTLEEYDSKVSDYITFVAEELRAKANLSDSLVLDQNSLSSDGIYSFSFTYSADNVTYTYYFSIDNSKAGIVTGLGGVYDEKIFYEVEVDAATLEGSYEEYKQAVLDKFFEEKSITDYYVRSYTPLYIKDSATGEFSYYNGEEDVEKFFGQEIIDFSTNTIYTVIYLCY